MPTIQFAELPDGEVMKNETMDGVIKESAPRDIWVARLLVILKLVVALGAIAVSLAVALK